VSADDNADGVCEALDGIATGGVARAARDDAGGRFKEGESVGYAGEDLVAWGSPGDALTTVLARVCDGAEVVTIVAGEGAPLPEEEIAKLLPDGVELDHHDGGQPAWWWLIAAE
jgi:hypothetical protein